jgi:hypothetical protein
VAQIIAGRLSTTTYCRVVPVAQVSHRPLNPGVVRAIAQRVDPGLDLCGLGSTEREGPPPQEAGVGEEELRPLANPNHLLAGVLDDHLPPGFPFARQAIERGVLDQGLSQPPQIRHARKADGDDQAGVLLSPPASSEEQAVALTDHILGAIEPALLRVMAQTPFTGPVGPQVLQEGWHGVPRVGVDRQRLERQREKGAVWSTPARGEERGVSGSSSHRRFWPRTSGRFRTLVESRSGAVLGLATLAVACAR